jgi:1-acyl-sn-glycerol-3-phosphate acyltransferase
MSTFWLRWLFFALVVRPGRGFLLGLKTLHADRLPRRGPALVVANHNSHLDAIALMALFPLRTLPWIRAAAAADYWNAGGFKAWFARHVVGIVAVSRTSHDGSRLSLEQVLAPVSEALSDGRIVVFFPEGTRGEPGEMLPFKRGLAWLAAQHPDVPIHPVTLIGLEKAMPRGEWMMVPRMCTAFIHKPLYFSGDGQAFGDRVRQVIASKIDTTAAATSGPESPPRSP